ncbi:MAG: alkaline phosphatase family protein [Dehalococcoidia bacterium]
MSENPQSSATMRTVIIGLDGMPFGLMKNLAENGTMPNTREIIRNGTFRQMESSIPEISSVAWSSVITGTNPAGHGIFGFTDIPEGTYRLSFPNFNNLKATPFWNRNGSGPSAIINVPSTYPAAPLNGVLIAGFVALDLEKATYPPSLLPELNDMSYQIDVDASKAQHSMDIFLEDLDRTLKSRVQVYRHLWDKEDWETFMLVFTGTDRLSHFLWDAYEDESHKYHAAFLDHLHQIDEAIGEIAGRMGGNDTLLMLSDHGFELSEVDVNVNYLLRQEGFLKFKNDTPKSLADIDYGTMAFALDPARIYINSEGKYPRGSVKSEEKAALLDELESCFNSLEVNGKKVIERICRKEEIYTGPYIDQAPELALLPHKGFNLKGNIKAGKLTGKGVFTGKHSQKDAFLLINKSVEDIMPEKPCVDDVVGIMDSLRQ